MGRTDLSPSGRELEYYRKLFLYRSAGVREYWIVDSDRNRISVCDFRRAGGGEYAMGEDVPVGIYEGRAINVI